MSAQEAEVTVNKEGKPFALEPLSMAIRRFSLFDSDDEDAASDNDDSSSAAEANNSMHGMNRRDDHDGGSSSSVASSDEEHPGKEEFKKGDARDARPASDAGAASPPQAPPPAPLETPAAEQHLDPPSESLRASPARPAEDDGNQLRDHEQDPPRQAVAPALVSVPQQGPAARRSPTRPPQPTLQAEVPPCGPRLIPRSASGHQKPTKASGRKTIYERGVMQQRATDRKIEEMRASLATREVDGATFRPTISARARRLHRSPDAVLRQQHDEEVLRKRLQVLEAPVEETTVEHTFCPQISARSEQIVRACRTGNPGLLPASERLYLDHVYRGQAAAASPSELSSRAPEVAGGTASLEPVRRSKSQIDNHIATLFAFEQRRRETVLAVQESEQAGPTRALYVDPNEVVERLTRPRAATSASAAGALVHVPDAGAPSSLPTTSVVPREMSDLARSRGLLRWFGYFAGNQPSLATHKILAYDGHHTAVAKTIANVLLRADVLRSEWTPEAFLSAMDAAAHDPQDAELRFWRTRPVTATAQERECTFRPQLNPTSERLLSGAALSTERRGATHDRLFAEARLQQLQKQQTELEKKREEIAAAEDERRRRAGRAQRWRKQSREVLLTATVDSAASADADGSSAVPIVIPSNAAKATTPSSDRDRREEPPSYRKLRTRADTHTSRKRSVSAEKRVKTHTKKPTRPVTAAPVDLSSASLQAAFRELQATLDLRDVSAARGNADDVAELDDGDLSRTPLSIHSEHEEKAESTYTNSSVPLVGSDRQHAQTKHNLDFLLACAACRQPSTVRSSERQLLEQENRQRLRRLGLFLYDQQ